MAKDTYHSVRKDTRNEADADDREETRSLLSSGSSSDDDDIIVHEGQAPSPQSDHHNTVISTPRPPNRVRFQLDDLPSTRAEDRNRAAANGHPPDDDRDDSRWADEEDFLHEDAVGGLRSSSESHRAPLLTGIEAPSVTVATDFDAVEFLETARPKSGMRMAFMNMANSIM